jgi:hypothetical protein
MRAKEESSPLLSSFNINASRRVPYILHNCLHRFLSNYLPERIILVEHMVNAINFRAFRWS